MSQTQTKQLATALTKTIQALKEPVATRNEYLRQLLAILKAINDDFEKSVIKRLKQKDYIADDATDDVESRIETIIKAWSSESFRRLAQKRAKRFVLSVVKTTSRKFGIDRFKTPQIQKLLKQTIAQNTQLITSLASDHANAIANLVYNNILQGIRPEEIVENIQAYGVTKARAKLIAFDQVSKALGQIARIEQTSAGFEYFRWRTSKDERVRESHKKLGERVTKYGIGVYRWDDLPTINGEPMQPGSDFRCRCLATPVTEEEVEEFQRSKK